MWNTFMAELKGLKSFYKSMISQGVDLGVFSFTYKNVESKVILDTSCKPWKLTFIQMMQNDKTLRIDVRTGYMFTIDTDEKYQAFRRYFNISGERGKFSLKEFTRKLDSTIPSRYSLYDENRRYVMMYLRRTRKISDGIYPIGIINWKEKHAIHPEWPKNLFHRSPENLKKTKELYPNIYEATKDYDITVKYGDLPGKKTEMMRKKEVDSCESDEEDDDMLIYRKSHNMTVIHANIPI